MIYKRLILIFIALCSIATYAQQDIANQEKVPLISCNRVSPESDSTGIKTITVH